MNTPWWRVLIERLAEIGLDLSTGNGPRADGAIDFMMVAQSGEQLYAGQVKTRVSRESAGSIALAQHPERTMLVAPYIPEPAGQVLRDRGIDYADAAGNVHVQWDGTLVDVRGRRQGVSRTSPTGRLWQPRGLQVIFVLLCRPALVGQPLRSIAGSAGASVGAVQRVTDELATRGFILKDKSGRRLVQVRTLFDRWVEAYTLTLAPRLHLNTFAAPDPMWWQKADDDLRSADVQLGGESAASRLRLGLSTTNAVLYVEQTPADLALKYHWRTDRPEPDADPSIELRRRFWRPAEGLLTPSPLIYADLIASGDARQREAAVKLRKTDDALRLVDTL